MRAAGGRLDGGQAGIGRSCAVVLEIGIFVMCRVFSNPPSLVVRGYIAPTNQPELVILIENTPTAGKGEKVMVAVGLSSQL